MAAFLSTVWRNDEEDEGERDSTVWRNDEEDEGERDEKLVTL